MSRVVNLAQTSPDNARQNFQTVGSTPERIMAVPKNDKHKDYVRYAARCLDIVPSITDQDDRAINCEMAAEWLRLADAFIELSKPIKRSA
jgi:hypothetical protein